ncbi:hypothetical protein [Microbulbifer epialgicus]|uniref:Lipoprotein n=1 Tax=Microbulbifer epialgicus TaxID=393907 RepID=A0ABV4NUQ0_9GAMM
MNLYLKTIILISFAILIGCESDLRKEDKKRIDTLNDNLAQVSEKLNNIDNAKSVDSSVEKKPPIYVQPRFESDIDRALHELEVRKGFTHLKIYPLGNGNYKVEAITRNRVAAVKEISLPASIAERAGAARGYQVEIRRLINQSERGAEKELVVEVVRSILQG